ncbi:hypothetical protein [Streptomyces sp. NPDC046759]|uniref:hypothetical protein n=1 Tax=Streptomyces sp. NPDC046759 TaxID=3155019 RepID=UPI0033D9EF76
MSALTGVRVEAGAGCGAEAAVGSTGDGRHTGPMLQGFRRPLAAFRVGGPAHGRR